MYNAAVPKKVTSRRRLQTSSNLTNDAIIKKVMDETKFKSLFKATAAGTNASYAEMMKALAIYPHFCKPQGYSMQIGNTVFTENERCTRELSAFLANVVAETMAYENVNTKAKQAADLDWEANNAMLHAFNSTCSTTT